jgi:hypothetical protein
VWPEIESVSTIIAKSQSKVNSMNNEETKIHTIWHAPAAHDFLFWKVKRWIKKQDSNLKNACWKIYSIQLELRNVYPSRLLSRYFLSTTLYCFSLKHKTIKSQKSVTLCLLMQLAAGKLEDETFTSGFKWTRHVTVAFLAQRPGGPAAWKSRSAREHSAADSSRTKK